MGSNDCSRCGGWPKEWNRSGEKCAAYCSCTEADYENDDLQDDISQLKSELEEAKAALASERDWVWEEANMLEILVDTEDDIQVSVITMNDLAKILKRSEL